MDGLINIYKEKGFTSHDVVAIIRRLLKTKKVGHAGTLDPEAEGVLIILVGKATKLSDYMMAENKEYRAEISFGIETDTYDNTGKVVSTCVPNFTEAKLKTAIQGFIGEQMQIPPMYSAIKSGGVKLYNLAREGMSIERCARKIVISEIELEQFNGKDKAVIYIKCGKGTYIRSLCYDLGKALHCGAHMSSLIRTKSGVFMAESATKLSRIKEMSVFDNNSDILMGMEKALEGFTKIIVSKEAGTILYNGGKIERKYLLCDEITDTRPVVAYDEGNILIGIYDIIRDGAFIQCLRPRTMLF